MIQVQSDTSLPIHRVLRSLVPFAERREQAYYNGVLEHAFSATVPTLTRLKAAAPAAAVAVGLVAGDAALSAGFVAFTVASTVGLKQAFAAVAAVAMK
eukprot:CAMPEP_0119377234 /NCGR_PEP_ID=MMETSP1334-20130426/43811_1 /TAXON_ID=127549 /ORGANISM="Calcidiscus leptoporus, Strain RCC1130" /LENGTH=97 /DNA_ID=CAMNT_0007396065 /DNA_START=95 /DNA_END=388 /DNA_ORIENTATION=-